MDDEVQPLPELPEFTYEQKLRIWETNYGRDCGWILERHGEPIALFTYAGNLEMFWDNYRVEPLTDEPKIQAMLKTKTFWNEMDGLVWRNREFNVIAPNAFPGGYSPTESEDNYVSMRALYIDIEPPLAAKQLTQNRFVSWIRKILREGK